MSHIAKDPFDAAFADGLGTNQTLYDLINAAIYMKIDSLLDLIACKLASMIKGESIANFGAIVDADRVWGVPVPLTDSNGNLIVVTPALRPDRAGSVPISADESMLDSKTNPKQPRPSASTSSGFPLTTPPIVASATSSGAVSTVSRSELNHVAPVSFSASVNASSSAPMSMEM